MNLRLVVILLSTGMTSFLSTYLAAAVNLALKTIGAEFSAGASSLSLVASLYLLMTSLCLIPFGRLSDAFGPKRTLLFGCFLFVLSNMAVPLLATSFTSLLILRSLQGVCAAFLMVSNIPLVAASFPEAQRATGLGFLSAMVFMGASVGNFLGGLLTEHFGWRSIFTSAALAGLLAFVCIWLFVPAKEKLPTTSPRKPLDFTGIILYALTLIALQWGAATLATPTGIALLLCVPLGLALFLRRQFTAENPIYDIQLLVSNRTFALAILSVFLAFAATYGSQYLLPLYLQCNRGMSPAEAGKITLFQPLAHMLLAPLSGMMAARFAPHKLSSAGLIILTIALGILALLQENTPLLLIYLALILFGAGVALFSVPNTSLIMSAVPVNKRGIATASSSIMRNLGMQISIILCGLVFFLKLGQSKGISASQYPDMLIVIKICYSFFALLCVGGAILSLRRK